MMNEFFAYGVPQQMGSKHSIPLKGKDGKPLLNGSGMPRTITTDGNPKLADWRAEVRRAFCDANPGIEPLMGPVRLAVEFGMPRPASHYGTGRNAGVLKPSAPVWVDGKIKDLDKLLRALKDALTSCAYRDDCQVCWVEAIKVYSDRPGARVQVRGLAESRMRELAEVPQGLLFG